MAIITVTTANDSGVGSLRTAIASAQAGDTITFASDLANQTIALTTGEITITKNVTIDGSAAPNLTISGSDRSRIFMINNLLDVSIAGLTFIDGRAVVEGTGIGEGGAIKVRGSSRLTVENSTFKDNVAERGGAIQIGYGSSATVLNSIFDSNDGSIASDGFSAGAISTYGAGGPNGTGKLEIEGSTFANNKGVNGGAVYVLLAPLSIENSTFSNNQSLKQGGAVFTDGASGSQADTLGGTTTISSSRFEGNRSVAGGGALYLWGYTNDQYIVKDSTLIDNSVTRGGKYNVGRGGAIEHSGGSLTLDGTTLARNVSPGQGGGLWVNNNTAAVTITNTTISNNTAQQDAGGGIFLLVPDGRPVTITNSTLAGNIAGRDAGAIWTSGLVRDVTLKNTLFAKNTATQTRQGNTNFQLKDGGGNLVETLTGNKGPKVTATATYVSDLKLDTLQQVGRNWVHPLLQGSPAINSGVSGAPATDQRGISRDKAPDVGAYELTSSDISAVSSPIALRSFTNSDSIFGGIGNDIYYVYSAAASIVEEPNAGIDRVEASVSWTLGDHLENLTLIGTAAIDGTGNALNNSLVGNAAANTLSGGDGDDLMKGNHGDDQLLGGAGNDKLLGGRDNDYLMGGSERDTLTGGLGKDRFDLTTTRTEGFDTLRDFNGIDDQILISKSEFGLDQQAGTLLQADLFRLGASATAATDRFIYDSATGKLFFDPDGLGGAEQVQIATLSNKAELSSSHLMAIA
ncbi:choice-of-anchor Q domain-containing protein [Altericista sp. CCNU0014]|uniref:choice-of-anchor Q domain-containing protein n=1 Tax=Altericista sp. CCNU0014 TaxID=3082949 RepID=UPI00384DB2CE